MASSFTSLEHFRVAPLGCVRCYQGVLKAEPGLSLGIYVKVTSLHKLHHRCFTQKKNGRVKYLDLASGNSKFCPTPELDVMFAMGIVGIISCSVIKQSLKLRPLPSKLQAAVVVAVRL